MQICGSRHAWDIRLISADALLKLVRIKENTEGPDTAEKRLPPPSSCLSSITRLDGFDRRDLHRWRRTPRAPHRLKTAGPKDEGDGRETGRRRLRLGLSLPTAWPCNQSGPTPCGDGRERLRTKLIKHSRALFQNAAHHSTGRGDNLQAIPHASIKHRTGTPTILIGTASLGEAGEGFLVLGCMDRPEAYLLPPLA